MSTTKLVRDLENIIKNFNNNDNKDWIQYIMKNAKCNLYHDFKSEHPTPKILLFTHLQEAGLDDIIKNTSNGDYDD